MKRLLSIILSFSIALSLLTGCAETPEDPVVLQKDQEQMIKTANSLEDASTTITAQTAVPEKVQDSFSNDSGVLNVTVNADVLLPETDTAQIIRVVQHDITQEDVDRWTSVLFGDSTLYTVDSLAVETKDELQAQLLQAQKELAERQANGEALSTPDEDGYLQFQNRSDELQWAIEALECQIPSAPESRTPVETTNTLGKHTEENLSGSSIDDLETVTNEYEGVAFAVENEAGTGLRALHVAKENGCQTIIYSNQGNNRPMDNDNITTYQCAWRSYDDIRQAHENGEISDDFDQLSDLPEPALSQADARKQADDLIKDLGLDLDLFQAEQVLGARVSNPMFLSYSYLKGWLFRYVRTINSIPVTYTGVVQSEPEENAAWSYETLYVVVNDSGVVEAGWTAPYEMGEVESENCKLLDFNSVMEIFRKMLPIEYEPTTRGDYTNRTNEYTEDDIEITGIQFGYTRITEQNTASYSGLMVPTWTFFGHERIVTQESDGTEQELTFDTAPYLTINAIDGSIIDIEQGY